MRKCHLEFDVWRLYRKRESKAMLTRTITDSLKAIQYDVNTYPISNSDLHFRDRRGAASFRYRSRAKIPVVRCEQKP